MENFTAPDFKDLLSVALMEGLALRNQDEAVSDDDELNHYRGANPWLWLSTSGARELCRSIHAALIQINPENTALYHINLEITEQKLNDLADEIDGIAASVQGTKVALLHEGLAYVADEMQLDIVYESTRESAATLGDNEKTELLNDLNASGAQCILIESQAPASIVRFLTEAGFPVAQIDTLTTHTDPDPSLYFDVMLKNAEAVSGAATGRQ